MVARAGQKGLAASLFAIGAPKIQPVKRGSVEMRRTAKIGLTTWMLVQGLMRGESGQDLIEYGLAVTLIALACIASIGHLGAAVGTMFSNISTSLA
jgi:Flp pilus assembly pilin Flp